MLEPKNYQRERLADLERFFRLAGERGAKFAFMEQTERPYKTVPHFPELPYVCLRVPTGGGKTLMAARAVGIAARALLHTDAAVCLWLVPTKAILEQTLPALKDRSHHLHHALTSKISGPVSVMDIAEALRVQPGTLAGETVVIVSTLAAFRVEETDGRKVYESSGALMDHFSRLTAGQEDLLERNEDGTVPKSLANVLRLHRPIVIVDEAHNARTSLSFDTLARLRPSCVIEFTATPETAHDPENGKFASNVLCHVSALELDAEEMIKLPIRLELQPEWQKTVSAALAMRQHLEEVAGREEQATGAYVRPIILFQAQAKSAAKETVTPERLRQHLIDDCKVPADRIRIGTGSTWELDGVDLFARDCPVRFVITVNALREGWDCPFAYVLCSVAELGATKAVEQILGRVMRLPYAKEKSEAELNSAYAYVTSQNFHATALALTDALVQNGFEKIEAKDLVVRTADASPDLYPEPDLFRETTQAVPEAPRLDELPEDLRERVTYDAGAGTLTVKGVVTGAEAAALETVFATPAGRSAARAVAAAAGGAKKPEPPKRAPLGVPWLAVRGEDDLPELFEDQFLEVDWKLSACDVGLTDAEFPTETAAGVVGEIDLTAKGKLEVQFTEAARRQLQLFEKEPGWTLPALANWLDRKIPHPDISPTESRLFLLRALESLVEGRKLSAEQLGRRKHRLIDALAAKINQHRQSQVRRVYQQLLYGPAAAPVVEPAFCFYFEDGKYAPNWYYDGAYKFKKHFFPNVGELKTDGEEFECAMLLDQLSEVEWWVRNLERKPLSAFWLQTPSDRFYPDFVAFLKDGRRLVVEYKGADRWSNDDSKEKRQLGDLWASASGGHCLFAMPKGPDWPAIRKAVVTTTG